MKRTKEWWDMLNKQERSRLFELEHSHSSGYGAGGYLPDDCSDCGGCGNPIMGVGLCNRCSRELDDLIAKAEGR